MTYVRRRTILQVAMWGIAAIGVCITFFGYGGAATYVDAPARKAVGAVFIGFGLLGYPIAAWISKGRAKDGGVLADERDEANERVASLAALVVVAVFVFGLSIGLWEAYEDVGCVPVGWLWFLAYGTVIVVNLAGPVASMIADWKTGGRGEG